MGSENKKRWEDETGHVEWEHICQASRGPEFGNVAIMMSALKFVDAALVGWNAPRLRHRVEEALKCKARNCDVGTLEEQADRFDEFCQSQREYIDDFHGWDCRKGCPIGRIVDENNKFCDHCQLIWSQMPFERSSDEKEKKKKE